MGTEPETPYSKQPLEPVDHSIKAPPMPPPEPPPGPPPPFSQQAPKKFICPTCRKVFNTNEELTLHIETVHESPKKKV